MKANELRTAFTEFFVRHGHVHRPSASLIPHDPTLLFTVAGMVPFKNYLTGDEPAPWPRAVSVQKCVRAGGKHNDLDEIGRTARHLTFFEMLGNFSFGDYFKQDAIGWAWEFVTDVMALEPDRLWVTVHHSDDEAADIWRRHVGVAPERIQRLGEDNYWRMADTGPCGPCTEIFYDQGRAYGPDGGPKHGGQERFLEFWNLVFMQFEQHDDGSLTPLPKPSIDTGLGLERTVSLLQGVDSVWETNELSSLLRTASEFSGVDPDPTETDKLVSLRILADHARSTSLLVSDGVFPSNEARGYVLRRILRRAVRHAHILGVGEPVMGSMVDAVVETMRDAYPELVTNHGFVREVINREEVRFRETLRAGQAIVDRELASLAAGQPLAGDTAFMLHDTYGFPLELTAEIASELGVAVDVAGFAVAMDAQQKRAKAARRVHDTGFSELVGVLERHGATEFTGRAEVSSTGTVLYVNDDIVVLDRTPFYAESGGQIGDTGTISTATATAHISDCRYGITGVHIHDLESVEGRIEVGQQATATIDNERRAAIRRSHTGTHILHWALRTVLGQHVKQQGSAVGPDRLRFDFSHYEALTAVEIAEVEDLVNAEVLSNANCRHFETTMDHAMQLGAIAFFGDRYGHNVRVLEAGENSVELCGGTHVRALGDIGHMHIVTESSIGSNIRRLTAVTGMQTVELLRETAATAAAAAAELNVTVDELPVGIDRLRGELKVLRNEVSALKRRLAKQQASALAADAVNGVVVAQVDGVDRDGLRDLAVSVRDLPGVRAVVLGSGLEGAGAVLVAAVTPGSGLNAGYLISDAKRTIGGGGRAAADLAMAGGRLPEQLGVALEQVRSAAGIV